MGADPFFLGLLASSFALPALLTALPAGRLTDRVGGSVVAITGMLIAAAGTVGGFAFPGQWTLLAAAACIGFGQILIMVGQQTFVAHVSARQGSDAAFGTLTAAASIGQLVGPPTVTTLASLAVFGGQTQPEHHRRPDRLRRLRPPRNARLLRHPTHRPGSQSRTTRERRQPRTAWRICSRRRGCGAR